MLLLLFTGGASGDYINITAGAATVAAVGAAVIAIGAADATVAVAAGEFVPRGRTPPRREYVWVRDLAGEQIGVIR